MDVYNTPIGVVNETNILAFYASGLLDDKTT